jgi:GR25 family glycosyltransferase involved in LPS biosynthesis
MNLPRIYYINLDHRTDRNTEFLSEMNKLRQHLPDLQVTRVPAIKHETGAIGCGMSHCKALEMFLATNDETAIVMEDDYQLYDKMIPMLCEYLQSRSIPEGGDILLLAANLRQQQPWRREFIRVHRSFTTSGYWLNRKIAEALLRLWECVTTLHTISIRQPEPRYCIDVSWWELMHPDSPFVFLAMTPLIGQIGHQRPGYSDIERRCVNYLV